MSEQARIAALQEKIRNSRIAMRLAGFVGFLSAFLGATGFGLHNSVVGVIGSGIMILSIVAVVASSYTANKLFKELENVGIQRCPKCGKQIPQGNFPFCPYCGATLEK